MRWLLFRPKEVPVGEILLITAQGDSCEAVLQALETEGVSAKVANDWKQARNVFSTTQVDLVMVDQGKSSMPVLDLVGALPELEPIGVDIPLILLGSNSAWELRARELRAGATDYVDMPFAREELSALVAARLRTKNRIDRLKSDASVDQLTGAYNRRYLDTQITSKLGEARRYGHPLSCAIMDIDRFKRINDTWGHQMGDSVLKGVATLTRKLMREGDLLARYGGEEFALVLNHTDALGAAILGKRVLSAIESARFAPEQDELIVTISMGIATFPNDDAETVEEFIQRADERLYRAKSGGRNRVVGLE